MKVPRQVIPKAKLPKRRLPENSSQTANTPYSGVLDIMPYSAVNNLTKGNKNVKVGSAPARKSSHIFDQQKKLAQRDFKIITHTPQYRGKYASFIMNSVVQMA